MVYIDPDEMGYLPYVRSWLEAAVDKNLVNQENSEFLYELFKMLEVGFIHVNTKCSVGIKQVNMTNKKYIIDSKCEHLYCFFLYA